MRVTKNIHLVVGYLCQSLSSVLLNIASILFFLGKKTRNLLGDEDSFNIKGKVILIEEVMCISFPSVNMFEAL